MSLSWPISEVAACISWVRSVGRSGPELLTLNSSHLDPHRTSAEICGEQDLHERPRPLHEHKCGHREKVLVFLLD